MYIVLRLFYAISGDTILIFFPKYYVNSCLCVRNSLSNVIVKAKYMDTTEGTMVSKTLWLLPRVGFSETGASR